MFALEDYEWSKTPYMIRNMSGLDFKIKPNFETDLPIIEVPNGADVQIHYKRNWR